MAPTHQLDSLLGRMAAMVFAAAVAAGVAVAMRSADVVQALAQAILALPTSHESSGVRMSPDSSKEPDWIVFRSIAGGEGGQGSAKARIRVAGTFFAYGEGVRDVRKAILDDLSTGEQRIVRENESIAEFLVVRILRESVVLRGTGGEEQLMLSFSGSQGGHSGGTQAVARIDWPDTGVDRFGGKQVGDGRWVFSRQSLLKYYQDLRDDPERLVKVFDSLKPVYDDQRKITGYRLGIEGEAEFFQSTGLKDGDVVRSVNALAMTNRRRAEFLISQFITEGANAYVISVDRDSENVKLTYEIR